MGIAQEMSRQLPAAIRVVLTAIRLTSTPSSRARSSAPTGARRRSGSGRTTVTALAGPPERHGHEVHPE
jgi:hypothetical protein